MKKGLKTSKNKEKEQSLPFLIGAKDRRRKIQRTEPNSAGEKIRLIFDVPTGMLNLLDSKFYSRHS
jgi:hypothetical protein